MSKILDINLKAIADKFNKEEPQGKIGLTLLDRAVFMQEELKKLEARIAKEGSVTEMCQGSYTIDRINPAVNAYNGIMKNYSSVIKQLNDLIPVEENENDEFEDF